MILKFPSAKAETAKAFKSAAVTLIGYPFVIVITWLPSSFTDFLITLLGYDIDISVPFAAAVLNTLMGFLSTLVFFYCDNKTVHQWTLLAKSGFSLKEYEQQKRNFRSSQDLLKAPSSSRDSSNSRMDNKKDLIKSPAKKNNEKPANL